MGEITGEKHLARVSSKKIDGYTRQWFCAMNVTDGLRTAARN